MRKLIVFNQVSVDGYFADENSDMSWAHQQSDPEWNAFTINNARGGGELLFGRVTYQLMESFWPTPQAQKQAPEIAGAMNGLPKVVFSRTLEVATWKNTRLVRTDIAAEVKKMKAEPGKELVLMGSGSIVTQLSDAGLVDAYQLVVNPIVLGQGRSLFAGIKKRLSLKRTDERPFKNGNLVVTYEPAK